MVEQSGKSAGEIIALLKDRGLTITQLAREFGVDASHLGHVIKGSRKSRRLMEKLAVRLGVPVQQLDGRERESTRDLEGPLERLWAPWRYRWIREASGGVEGCFLCDNLADNPEKDRENLVLIRGEVTMVVMNRYPYSNGHLLVAPHRHIADPRDLNPEEWAEIGALTQVSLNALETAMSPHGFNIGWNIGQVSGAGLDTHVHQHIVPRWSGDTNFMPVVGETKILSQALHESFDELLKAIETEKV